MKFIPIVDDEISLETLKSEYVAAASGKYGRLSLGETILFYKKGLKCFFIPLDKVYRAFRRVKAVPARIRGAKGEIRLEYLVVCSNKDELAEFDLPDETAVNKLLEEIQIKSPKTKIGKKEK